MDNKSQQYRTNLTALSDMITPQELENMKFYCRDYLKARQMDEIKTPIMLWSTLEERKLLGPDNLDFLIKMLNASTSGRKDVFDVLTRGGGGDVMDARQENQQRSYRGPDLSREINFLVKHLAKDWRFFVRSLGVQEEDIEMVVANNPRDVREQVHQAIWVWLYKEQENADKKYLTNALLDIRRRDLAHKLKEGDY